MPHDEHSGDGNRMPAERTTKPTDSEAARRRAAAPRMAGASVHASLASEIGQRIVRGDYPPGTILPNEVKWSETFEVSRSAVREAIKMLAAKSLLVSRPKVGSWVEPKERWNLLDRDVLGWYAASPDQEKFLRTVQEFRRIIEPEAAALAARRRRAPQMAAISEACAELSRASSIQERTLADTRFHLAILRASGNDLLNPLGVMIESALNHLFSFVSGAMQDHGRSQFLHEEIERSIRLRRPKAARQAVHLLLACNDEAIDKSRK
mgnify:CR=1 FL=1